MFESSTSETPLSKIENSAVVFIEKFGYLPQSAKHLGGAAIAMFTGIVTELTPDPRFVPALSAAVASVYFGLATRTLSEDYPAIIPED